MNKKRLLYIQLDYLRLFRLCRKLGIVNRKRKVPGEYDTDGKALGATRRLLKDFVKHIFPECSITSGRIIMAILPSAEHNVIRDLNNKSEGFFSNAPDGERAQELLRELREHIDGFVCPALPYEIRILSSSSVPMSRFNAIAVKNHMTNRPPDEFYRCALACLKYREIWDRNMAFLREFLVRESAMEAERIAEREREKKVRRAAERERLKAEKHLADKDKEIIAKKMREMKEKTLLEEKKKKEQAQNLFNQAMEKYVKEAQNE
jgi:hypothetical protein